MPGISRMVVAGSSMTAGPVIWAPAPSVSRIIGVSPFFSPRRNRPARRVPGSGFPALGRAPAAAHVEHELTRPMARTFSRRTNRTGSSSILDRVDALMELRGNQRPLATSCRRSSPAGSSKRTSIPKTGIVAAVEDIFDAMEPGGAGRSRKRRPRYGELRRTALTRSRPKSRVTFAGSSSQRIASEEYAIGAETSCKTRHHETFHSELGGDRGDMAAGGAAAGHQMAGAQINAFLHGYVLDRRNHVVIAGRIHRVRRFDETDAEASGDRLDGAFGGPAVELVATAEEIVGVDQADDHIGVRNGRNPCRPLRSRLAPASPRRFAGRHG